MIAHFPLLVAILLLVTCIHCIQALSPEECLQKGFNPDILQCPSCEVLSQSVGEEQLISDCKSCCIDVSSEDIVYSRAILEVDKRFLSVYSDLSDVIKMRKSIGLEVRYIPGSRPHLLLYSKIDDSTAADSLSVGTWSKDTLLDYLKSHLKQTEE